MTEPPRAGTADHIRALPILLLVLGALAVGIGLWGLVRQPASYVLTAGGLAAGVVFFVAAGRSMRSSALAPPEEF